MPASPVRLELGFAGSAHADPADRLTRKVRPHPGQSRQAVFELRRLDLQATLVGLGSAGKDIEDQRRAVDDLGVQRLLQIAKLGGRKLVVDDDHVVVERLFERFDLLEFAAPHIGGSAGESIAA